MTEQHKVSPPPMMIDPDILDDPKPEFPVGWFFAGLAFGMLVLGIIIVMMYGWPE